MAGLSGDSIAPLLTWRPGDVGPRPGFGGTGEDIRYMQGTVVQWNPDTAENIVRIRGVDHNNVPLIDLGVGQRVMQPGDQVAIMAWSPNGGTAAYFIMGRLVVPGTTAAQRSEQALESLIEQLSPGIFAARVDTDTIPQAEGTTSSSFTDLATVGPQVTLDVSDARKAIVWLSSRMDAIAADNLVDTKDMSVAVTGASSIGAAFANALTVEHANNDTGHSSRVRTRASVQVTLTAADGLNAGTNTFTAKYRTGETSFSFADRTMTVMAL